MFAGPALGGVLLAVGSIPLVFVVSATLLLGSAALLVRLPAKAEPSSEAGGDEAGLSRELDGRPATVSRTPLRLVVGMMGAQTLVWGCSPSLSLSLPSTCSTSETAASGCSMPRSGWAG